MLRCSKGACLQRASSGRRSAPPRRPCAPPLAGPQHRHPPAPPVFEARHGRQRALPRHGRSSASDAGRRVVAAARLDLPGPQWQRHGGISKGPGSAGIPQGAAALGLGGRVAGPASGGGYALLKAQPSTAPWQSSLASWLAGWPAAPANPPPVPVVPHPCQTCLTP